MKKSSSDIIAIIIIGLVGIVVLGLFTNVFSGNSDDDGTKPPATKPTVTVAPDTSEETEGTTPDVPEESTTDTATPEESKHFRVNIDSIHTYLIEPSLGGELFEILSDGGTRIDEVLVLDGSEFTASGGYQIHGWFMIDSGVSYYRAVSVDHVTGDVEELCTF